jgi:hypothetical protein
MNSRVFASAAASVSCATAKPVHIAQANTAAAIRRVIGFP